ncbi:MAG: acetate--CoA ligase family protein [Opitutaceae bacterium]|nr:acetate--CoA ligase family protein [Opitutaceae bacterium]
MKVSAPAAPAVRRPAGLAAVFGPRAIALIGASERPGSVGRALMENLRAFPGRLFPVNPRHDFVLDRRAYAAVAAAPEPVDLAVIAVPAPAVPGVVRECVDAGVAAAIVISAGFRECGPAGAELERQVQAEAARGPLRIVGPNCLGIMLPHAGLNASFAASAPRPGSVAFLSQSGALCSAVIDWSRGAQVGFSAFVSVGSMLDVGWPELLAHLRDDPLTRSILLYLESVGDARAFLAAARSAALAKPVILLKAGRTPEAARAAASHTGALAGRDDILDAALRRAGVLRVDTVADLFGVAGLLARQPVPSGARLAIVTNAGGPGALATDALVLGGGRLAPLSPASCSALDHLLPGGWSRANPIDVLGDATPDRFGRAVEIAVEEPDTDGVLAILTPQTMTDPTGTAARVQAIAGRRRKPLLACWMGGEAVAAGRRILHDAGIPCYAYPEAATRAFDYLWRFGALQRRRRADEAPAAAEAAPPAASKAAAPVAALVRSLRAAGRTTLSEFESQHLLSLYGLGSVETRLARTPDEAAAAAAGFGYPVAVKLHSQTITHKSDVDGVRLDVRDEAGLRAAWLAIGQAVARHAGPEHFLGVTVQPMVAGDGRELILGSSADAQFGPVLLFGAGGRFVELLRDCSLGLPPLNRAWARRLIEETRIAAALKGARGRPAVDLAQLEDLLLHLSRLAVEQPAIREIDLNPVVWSGNRLLALDARVVLHPREIPVAACPRPALLPAAQPP